MPLGGPISCKAGIVIKFISMRTIRFSNNKIGVTVLRKDWALKAFWFLSIHLQRNTGEAIQEDEIA